MLKNTIENWFISLIEKILEDPIRNGTILIFSSIIAYYFGRVLYETFGLFTLLGYSFACLQGLIKIIDDPRRPIFWGVGFVVGANAVNLFFENFLPMIEGKNMVSIISGLVILYVILTLYLKAKELKNY